MKYFAQYMCWPECTSASVDSIAELPAACPNHGGEIALIFEEAATAPGKFVVSEASK